MRCVYAAAVCLLAAAAALAAPPKLDIPAELKPESGYATYTPPADVKDIIYISHDGLIPLPAAILKDARILAVPTKGEAAKRYRFTAVASNAQGELSRADFVIPIGAEPDDVIPPPKPKPPEPKPADGPLRVIFVYETGDSYTTAQQAVLFGDKVRVYLDANAKGWRRFDKDVDAANERDAEIKALWAASKGKVTAVPCVVVASGTTADIVPLPADEAAALELFRKYGGK